MVSAAAGAGGLVIACVPSPTVSSPVVAVVVSAAGVDGIVIVYVPSPVVVVEEEVVAVVVVVVVVVEEEEEVVVLLAVPPSSYSICVRNIFAQPSVVSLQFVEFNRRIESNNACKSLLFLIIP